MRLTGRADVSDDLENNLNRKVYQAGIWILRLSLSSEHGVQLYCLRCGLGKGVC